MTEGNVPPPDCSNPPQLYKRRDTYMYPARPAKHRIFRRQPEVHLLGMVVLDALLPPHTPVTSPDTSTSRLCPGCLHVTVWQSTGLRIMQSPGQDPVTVFICDAPPYAHSPLPGGVAYPKDPLRLLVAFMMRCRASFELHKVYRPVIIRGALVQESRPGSFTRVPLSS